MARSAHKSWMGRLPGAVGAGAPGAPPPHASQPPTAGQPPAAPAHHGLGLTSERSRERMVGRLKEEGISHPAVLRAMAATPRHLFVDEGLASRAYEDSALPIGHGQTISQPYVVARMTEALFGEVPLVRVLEIGTGCGYQAAILAAVALEAYSVERIRALHERARQNLRPLRLANLRLVHGDGLSGLPEVAPFDGMLIAAAAEHLPESLLLQLRVGAAAVAPVGGERQTLLRIVRAGPRRFVTEELGPVRFVPLLPGLL